jgi:hypothetical protein
VTKRMAACYGTTVACVLLAACSSSESGSPSPSTGTASKPSGPTTPSDARSSLVGGHTRSYIRRVRGVSQTRPYSPGRRLWEIHLIPAKEPNRGVLLVSYLGAQAGTFRGRAYEYSSDEKTLRLGVAAKPKDLAGDLGSFKLVLGGFECPPGHAIYTWRLADHDITLRLRATEESCAVRRAILAGDWRFSD